MQAKLLLAIFMLLITVGCADDKSPVERKQAYIIKTMKDHLEDTYREKFVIKPKTRQGEFWSDLGTYVAAAWPEKRTWRWNLRSNVKRREKVYQFATRKVYHPVIPKKLPAGDHWAQEGGAPGPMGRPCLS